jgi:hypothetical protein
MTGTVLPRLEHNPRARPRGFAQMFGLHPAIALLTCIVDGMLYGEEAAAGIAGLFTGGAAWVASLILSCCTGCILGYITYLAQKKWYGDDKDSALIKALVLGFLTALPFPLPLPAMFAVPAGAIGWRGRRKQGEDL